MGLRSTTLAIVALVLAPASLSAQVAVTGRVVDETGAGIAGARIEIRLADDGSPVAASSDLAGNFTLALPLADTYDIRAERQGFYVFHGIGQRFQPSGNQLTITLNHQQ